MRCAKLVLPDTQLVRCYFVCSQSVLAEGLEIDAATPLADRAKPPSKASRRTEHSALF